MASRFNDDYIRALLSSAPGRSSVSGRSSLSGLPHAAIAALPDSHAKAAAASPFPDTLSAASQKFFAAWQAWRGTQLLPRRQQVQLTAIARLMPQLVVLEVHGPERAIFRLAGTDIERQFGSRLTGRSFIKLAEPNEQMRRGLLLWRQVSQPCAAVLRQELEYGSGRRETVEIASAPVLPDSDGAPVQVFAVVSRSAKFSADAAAERGDPVIRNIGRNLRFIDIGAGIPPKD